MSSVMSAWHSQYWARSFLWRGQ